MQKNCSLYCKGEGINTSNSYITISIDTTIIDYVLLGSHIHIKISAKIGKKYLLVFHKFRNYVTFKILTQNPPTHIYKILIRIDSKEF